jgi:hypothetical protein
VTRSTTRHPAVRLRDTLAVPFACIRVPLLAFDAHLVQRLDRRTGVRIVFDCALGTVDILAGHLLAEDSITQYGMGRVRTALHPQPSGITGPPVRERLVERDG